MKKQTALVIAPGRGVYGATELGYLARHHADKSAFLAEIDAYRDGQGRRTVSALDSAGAYSASLHASSENASALIYACALADFQAIDRDRFDIIAVTGNSLGWYMALAAAGALSPLSAIRLVDTMGGLMERDGVGGQIVYPLVGADWRADAECVAAVDAAMTAASNVPGAEVYHSIALGGMAVLAGNNAGLTALERHLPPREGRFPLRLVRHAAFHTPLLDGISAQAQQLLSADLFSQPSVPMIDGRGRIWRPAHDLNALHAYTLGTQITTTYDFTRAVTVGIKEFCPDRLIVLGPGTSLGPPIAQILIQLGWRGMTNKDVFVAKQQQDPFMLAMGHAAQRPLVTGGAPAVARAAQP